METADRDLIDRCATGNGRAWGELVARFDRKVLRTVWRFCGQSHPGDVEDVRQEVWSRLWRNDRALLRTLRAERDHSLASFLAVMARTAALDHLKARRARPSSALAGDAALEVASDQPTPEQAAADQRWTACLAETLRLVAARSGHPGRDADILRLHYQEGYTATEIAATGVGLPIDGIEAVLRRTKDKVEQTAREQLREADSADEPDTPAPKLARVPRTPFPAPPRKRKDPDEPS